TASSLPSRPLPASPLFPYTTLFRSRRARGDVQTRHQGLQLPPVRGDVSPQLGDEAAHGLAGLRFLQVLQEFEGRHRARQMVVQRSEEHTSELQSPDHLVCRLLLEKK